MNSPIIIAIILTGSWFFGSSACARVSVCGTIYMDEQLLDLRSLETKISEGKCLRWKDKNRPVQFDLDLNFSSVDNKAPTVVHLTRSLTNVPVGFPDFIKYRPHDRRWVFDDSKFSAAVNDSPVYQSKAAEILKDGGDFSTEKKFRQGVSRSGSYWVVEILYVNNLTGQRWNEGYFSFVQPGVVSAFYNSPSLLSNAPLDKAFLNKISELFGSMSTVK